MPQKCPKEVSVIPKTVTANQKAVDALGPDSGEWRIAGTQGLVVRYRGGKRTFMVVRKIDGRNEKRTLAESTLAAAKVAGAKVWATMSPTTPARKLNDPYTNIE